MNPRTLLLGKCSAALTSGFFTWLSPELTWLFIPAGMVAFAFWDWEATKG